MRDIIKLLDSRKYIYFDGAFGTMLNTYLNTQGDAETNALPISLMKENPVLINIKAPDTVEAIHKAYIEAGSDIICSNTFAANAPNLKNSDMTPAEIIGIAIKLARNAAGDKAVALDIGSTGQMLEPAGDLEADEAYNIFKEMAVAGEKAEADLAAVETMSDVNELSIAVRAIRENTKLPVFATMTFSASGYTFMGCTPEQFADTAKDSGVAAIGINCSFEPKLMFGTAQRLANAASLPLIIKLNAGLPDSGGGYSAGPEEFASQMRPYIDLGVKIVGGCCGTTPEHIIALREVFK